MKVFRNNKGLTTVTIIIIIVCVVVVGGTIGGVVGYNIYQDKKQEEAELKFQEEQKMLEESRNNAVNSYNERINQIVDSLNVEKNGTASIDNNEDVDAMANAVNELNTITNEVNNDSLITQEQKDTLNGTIAGQVATVNNRINVVRDEAYRQAKIKAEEEEKERQRREKGYTNEQLCEMAKKYYVNTVHGSAPQYVEIDQDKGNTVVIHLYGIGRDGTHTFTYAWYEVDKHTGKGQEMTTYKDVDLTRY